MKRVPHNRLGGSKWTAVEPERREKHFEVIRVLKDEGTPVRVVLRALISKSERTVPARELEDEEVWAAGWRR